MIRMSGLVWATLVMRASLGDRERGARLVGNVYLRAKVPSDETDEPRAAAQLEDIQALEGFALPSDVLRQNPQ